MEPKLNPNRIRLELIVCTLPSTGVVAQGVATVAAGAVATAVVAAVGAVCTVVTAGASAPVAVAVTAGFSAEAAVVGSLLTYGAVSAGGAIGQSHPDQTYITIFDPAKDLPDSKGSRIWPADASFLEMNKGDMHRIGIEEGRLNSSGQRREIHLRIYEHDRLLPDDLLAEVRIGPEDEPLNYTYICPNESKGSVYCLTVTATKDTDSYVLLKQAHNDAMERVHSGQLKTVAGLQIFTTPWRNLKRSIGDYLVSKTWDFDSVIPSLTGASWRNKSKYLTLKAVENSEGAFLLARDSRGLELFQIIDDDANIVPLGVCDWFSDANFGSEGSSASLDYFVLNEAIFAFGRGPTGIGLYAWVSDNWMSKLPAVSLFADKDGWNRPEHAQTVRCFATQGGDLYCFGRSVSGMVAYKLVAGPQGWIWKLETTASNPPFSNASGWDKPEYYTSIKGFLLADGNLYTVARGVGGAIVYTLDRSMNSWRACSPALASWADSGGWNQPVYYQTIRSVVVRNKLYLFGVGAGGRLDLYRWNGVDQGFSSNLASGLFASDTDAGRGSVKLCVIEDRLFLLSKHGDELAIYALYDPDEWPGTPTQPVNRPHGKPTDQQLLLLSTCPNFDKSVFDDASCYRTFGLLKFGDDAYLYGRSDA